MKPAVMWLIEYLESSWGATRRQRVMVTGLFRLSSVAPTSGWGELRA